MSKTCNKITSKSVQLESLILRPADISDMQILFDWANSDIVRSMSLSTKKFSWETHKKWFEKCLRASTTEIFLGIDSNQFPIGQIRFDLVGNSQADVDVHTNPDWIGRGFGTQLIILGTQRFFAVSNVSSIRAIVLKNNIASIRAFQKAGYTITEEPTKKGRSLVSLSKNRFE